MREISPDYQVKQIDIIDRTCLILCPTPIQISIVIPKKVFEPTDVLEAKLSFKGNIQKIQGIKMIFRVRVSVRDTNHKEIEAHTSDLAIISKLKPLCLAETLSIDFENLKDMWDTSKKNFKLLQRFDNKGA